MVLTNKLDIYKKLLKLRNQGNSNKIRYYHDILGYNYRMTNIQAAIGFGQMNKIDEILKIKKKVFHFNTLGHNLFRVLKN